MSSVLKIRDENGNFIPINAIKGDNGKSAYEQAKEGGFNGTEEEFIALLNGLTSTPAAAHYRDLNNPHKVTAEQVGALSITGGELQGGLGLVGEGDANTSEIVQNSDHATIIRNKANDIATILALTNESKVDLADILKLWLANGKGYSIYGEHNKPSANDVGAIPETYYVSNDLDTELQQGGGKMSVCNYHSGTLNTPHSEGLTVFAHGMVITNAYDSSYGTQLCMPSGEDAIFVRRKNGSGISQWVRMVDEKTLQNLGTAKIATGSYVGTAKYGSRNPNTLTFDFEPKYLFISGNLKDSGGSAELSLIRGQTLTSSRYAERHTNIDVSWNGKTVTWYSINGQGSEDQLNYSNTTYRWVAIG